MEIKWPFMRRRRTGLSGFTGETGSETAGWDDCSFKRLVSAVAAQNGRDFHVGLGLSGGQTVALSSFPAYLDSKSNMDPFSFSAFSPRQTSLCSLRHLFPLCFSSSLFVSVSFHHDVADQNK